MKTKKNIIIKKTLLIAMLFIGVIIQTQAQWFVNIDATGNNDGTSWTDAYTDPSEVALSPNVTSGDTVWVAAGTYYPTYDASEDPTPTDPRAKLFALIGLDLHIYGGFNGTETQLNQRDWIANPTILSGDIGVVGDETDNCFTVFYSNRGFILDGFTISDGYADGTSAGPTRYGGGLYINSGTHSATVRNCIIKDNMAHYDAGLYCILSSPTAPKNVTIENTRFSNNFARWGAPFGFNVTNTSGAFLYVTMSNCLIDNNETGTFESASGGSFSGGRFLNVNNDNALEIKIVNSTFTKNMDNGGSALADRSLLGLLGQNTGAQIYNTIFWGNTVNTSHASFGYGTNSSHEPNIVEVKNTISKDTLTNLSYVSAVNNTHIDPVFTNSSSDDFTLQASSLAIDQGDTVGVSHLIPLIELNGEARYSGSSLDLGCYENQGTICTVNIPDTNFKTYLLGNSAINTNSDNEIQCSEASAFTGAIFCSSLSISDLTGLESFTGLTQLTCHTNQISVLDVSSNLNLTKISCGTNLLTSIDVTANNNLTQLSCQLNQLTNLEFNSNLTSLFCQSNKLTSLDLSNNVQLTTLQSRDNLLTNLNVANGNNTIINTFYADQNPNLSCIQVDDAAYSTTNWTIIDATSSFSTNCAVVSPVLVNSITVQGQGDVSTITTNGGTLQMEAAVLPANADDATYTWSVVNGTGAAIIDASGLLSATSDGSVEVKATANDASGTVGTKTITISNQSVGINDLAFKNFNVYPNPTSDFINLKISEELTSIRLMDLTGKTIKVFNTEAKHLNVAEFKTGIYLLEVANTNGKSIVKIIKK